MTFIRPQDQERLRARFEQELDGLVRLILFVRPPSGLFVPGREEPPTGRQAQQLMQELAALSPKLELEIHNPVAEPELAERHSVERTPALILVPGSDAERQSEAAPGQSAGDGHNSAAARYGQVRFFGLPSGYEFMTLVEDIVDVSRRATRLSPPTREALGTLPDDVHLQVFVTPT